MKKKILFPLIILAVIFSCMLSVSAFNEPSDKLAAINEAMSENNYLNDVELKYKDPFTYIIDPQHQMALIVKCKSTKLGAVIIPEELGGKPVYGVLSGAFTGCNLVTSIYIPSTVASIGGESFLGCSNLRKISVSKLSPFLYADSSGVLYSYDRTHLVYYPSNIQSTSYSVNKEVQSIGNYAFAYNPNLKKVTLHNNITTIGAGAFLACDSLYSMTVPDSTRSIGLYAFGYEGTGKIKSGFNLYSNNNLLAQTYALTNLVSLNGTPCKKVTVGNFQYQVLGKIAALIRPTKDVSGRLTVPSTVNGAKVTAIGEYAFFYNKGLTELELPDTVTFIGEMAFACCQKLKAVQLGNSLKVIGESAFLGCNSLKRVAVPSSIKVIGDTSLGVTLDFKNSCMDMVPGFYLCGDEDTVIYDYADTYNIPLYSLKYAPLKRTSKITAAQNETAVKLTWNKVKNAVGYRIFRKTSSGWKALGTTKNLTATIKNLSAGTNYSFAVRAYRVINGKTDWADTYTAITTATKSPAPSKVATKQNASAIAFSWSKSKNATGYVIYQWANGKWNKISGAITATTFTRKGLKAATAYKFAIRPYTKTASGNIYGTYKAFIAITAPATPTVKAAATAKGKITAAWSTVDGATGYQLYYKVGNGSYKLYKNYSKPQKVTFSVKAGTKYTFAVKAYTYSKNEAKYVYSSYKQISVTAK